MWEDPSEEKNLAVEMPEKVIELTTLFRHVVARSPLDGESWWQQLPWPKG
tara:strand:+ start:226 stop:375 length:150 start_codon:yes stop_codon:yes gene_type:complete